MNRAMEWFLNKPKAMDGFILALLVIIICFHPYYLHQELNFLELGLYLPGISAILDGQIPFRDFFHLRGPFELYFPALAMKFFGVNVAVLCTYFYVTTLLTLLILVVMAVMIYPARLWLYLMVPVLIVRTFPRVVFTYWGGMRYAFGVLAILMLAIYLKRLEKRWILLAALCSVLGGLISLEIGFSCFLAIFFVLVVQPKPWKGIMAYVGAVVALGGAYLAYLYSHSALGPYIHDQWLVVTQMTKTFLQTQPVPTNLKELIHAMFLPSDDNFHQMTPIYCYLAFMVYWLWRTYNRSVDWMDSVALALTAYSFCIFLTGFRNLWANVFEMALQPEKLVLFYLWAKIWPMLNFKDWRRYVKIGLAVGLIVSSLIFSFSRISKRFLFFRKDPLKGQTAEEINLPRISGMVLPQWQAQDLIQLESFVQANVKPYEPVWMYPELGLVHFVVHRPWVSRYPMPSLAWMHTSVYEQYQKDLKEHKPQYAIVNKQAPRYFSTSYFLLASNQVKFEEQMVFLKENYIKIAETPSYNIYKLR